MSLMEEHQPSPGHCQIDMNSSAKFVIAQSFLFSLDHKEHHQVCAQKKHCWKALSVKQKQSEFGIDHSF